MSLKAFHFFFIIIAALLSVVCALMGWTAYGNSSEMGALYFALGFAALAVLMSFYGVWFFKKSKKIHKCRKTST